MYAQAAFESMKADAITVAPYMGMDSVVPFLEISGNWVVLLALTSNEGSNDFQLIRSNSDSQLYEHVFKESVKWGTPDNMMFVVGATREDHFNTVRKHAPDHFLLVPGVGAQGGDLNAVCEWGMNDEVGLIINVSRGILYASNDVDYAKAAAHAALTYQSQMMKYM